MPLLLRSVRWRLAGLADEARLPLEAAVRIEIPAERGVEFFDVDTLGRAPIRLELPIDCVAERSRLGRAECGRWGAAGLTLIGVDALEEVGYLRVKTAV